MLLVWIQAVLVLPMLHYMASHDAASVICPALGHGVTRSKRKAITWCRKAAEQGGLVQAETVPVKPVLTLESAWLRGPRRKPVASSYTLTRLSLSRKRLVAALETFKS